jgi:putative ABC transport system ATP-binding protein
MKNAYNLRPAFAVMIQIDDLRFNYGDKGFGLQIPNLSFASAERVSLVGPSGSGKSTLLSLISGAVIPTEGKIQVGDLPISELSDARRRQFRLSNIGFVYQEFELVEYLTVAENIRLPFWLNRSCKWNAPAKDRLIELTEAVGIADKLKRKPEQLSRGERQRVAICRALITQPPIILADEPTASLDAITGTEIAELLIDQATKLGSLLLLTTHDPDLQHRLDRIVDVSQFSCGHPSSEQA